MAAQQQDPQTLQAQVRDLQKQLETANFTIRTTKNHLSNVQDVLEATQNELKAAQDRAVVMQAELQTAYRRLTAAEDDNQELISVGQEAHWEMSKQPGLIQWTREQKAAMAVQQAVLVKHGYEPAKPVN